jgi:hypothetical protein
MKLTTLALAAFALSGTSAFAHTIRHHHAIVRDAAPSVVLHPNYAIRTKIPRSDHIERNRLL